MPHCKLIARYNRPSEAASDRQIRREYRDRALFWNDVDLTRKLYAFGDYYYDGILPIAQTVEKREATTPHSIDTPRLDSALDVLRKLLSENQVLRT